MTIGRYLAITSSSPPTAPTAISYNVTHYSEVGLSVISVQFMELEVFWPDDSIEPVSERLEA
jgi:hypothetical protein